MKFNLYQENEHTFYTDVKNIKNGYESIRYQLVINKYYLVESGNKQNRK